MDKPQVLDLYFAEARSKLIDLAAFLDRVERAPGEEDFRLKTFRAGLRAIAGERSGDCARCVLLMFSDPTLEPLPAATTKSAAGAWPDFSD